MRCEPGLIRCKSRRNMRVLMSCKSCRDMRIIARPLIIKTKMVFLMLNPTTSNPMFQVSNQSYFIELKTNITCLVHTKK